MQKQTRVSDDTWFRFIQSHVRLQSILSYLLSYIMTSLSVLIQMCISSSFIQWQDVIPKKTQVIIQRQCPNIHSINLLFYVFHQSWRTILPATIFWNHRAKHLFRLHDEFLLQGLDLLEHRNGGRVRALQFPPPVHVHRIAEFDLIKTKLNIDHEKKCEIELGPSVTPMLVRDKLNATICKRYEWSQAMSNCNISVFNERY